MADVGQEGHPRAQGYRPARAIFLSKSLKTRWISAYPPLNSLNITYHYFLMVGGVGLNFSAPLTGIDTNVTDHKALGKRLLNEVVSSLVSTPVPQKALKSPPILMFFMFFSFFL